MDEQERRRVEQLPQDGRKVILQRDIVLITFPFSELTSSNVRPAIVLSNDKYNGRSEDFVAVPLTSNLRLRDYAMLITNNELESGGLIVDSKAKVDMVCSVSQRLVRTKIGRIRSEFTRKLCICYVS